MRSEPDRHQALAVIAKQPSSGQVKTRLCPPLDGDQAMRLYHALLADSLALAASVPETSAGVLYTPVAARAYFRALAPEDFFLVAQRGADLGERLPNGIADLIAAGFERVVIMDSDSPTLPRSHLEALFERLRDPACDAVLGPCEDGGYWAVGMKHPHCAIFQDIAWSTPAVFAQSEQRAREAGLRLARGPVWYDVDDGASLQRLQRELSGGRAGLARATRKALDGIGLLGGVAAQESAPVLARGDGTVHE